MSAENECIVYLGGIQKIEVIDRKNVVRVVNSNVPVTDVYASINLKAGKAFETLKFITETALIKVSSESTKAGVLHKVEVTADFTSMETFATTHKLLFGQWVLKITDNQDVIWLAGNHHKGGRFKKSSLSQINGGKQSGTVLEYNLSSHFVVLKNK